MPITFGETIVCRSCKGERVIRGMTCAACDGTGFQNAQTYQPVAVHPVARRTDPATSWAAAASIPEERLRESQRAVLAVLRTNGPGTDEDIARWLDDVQFPLSPSGARTRRAELVNAGYVRDSGRRGLTTANRATIVWEAR
jgi:hypothetical protein